VILRRRWLPPQQGRERRRGPQAGPTGQASGHRYLIETNPALTDLRQFHEFGLPAAQMGFDPGCRAETFSATALTEQRLVRRGHHRPHWSAYPGGMSNDEAMFRLPDGQRTGSARMRSRSAWGVALDASKR